MKLAQPSPDPSGPGIHDLSNGKMVESNIIVPDMRYELGEKYGEPAIGLQKK